MSKFLAGKGLQKVKKCKRRGCKNLVPIAKRFEYCIDPECMEKRDYKALKREYAREYRKISVVHSSNINLRIPKREHLIGRTLNIRCGAKGINGRYNNKFTVPYITARRWYPKYCECHRNEYQRKRFEQYEFKSYRKSQEIEKTLEL